MSIFSIVVSRAPELMNENLDSESLARSVAPELAKVLRPEQLHFLQLLDAETARWDGMGRKDRRLIQEGMQRLTHPDQNEWLRRIDSFEF
jgi:hypothetical protein